MTEIEQLLSMLKRAGVKFQISRSKKDKKIVTIFGRFASDQTMFKFDESGNLYFVGSFEEPSIHWSQEYGKFFGGRTVRKPSDLTEEQLEEYKERYKGHPALENLDEFFGREK